MSPSGSPVIDTDLYKAAILDLDGVVTQTAKVHARAWKEMFDQFLASRSGEYEPLDIETDYRQYIDGKPRYDGVRSFLESRGIHLPEGEPDDAPEQETICGLGNRKNDLFRKVVRRDGVEIYQDTVHWLKRWKRHGLRTGIISSSKNCKFILEEAELLYLFDIRVDGLVAMEVGIEGKPAPDIFLYAAEKIGIAPSEAVVFEDAISGVQAGDAGNFGLVVGVSRNGNEDELLNEGAEVVIHSFHELETRFSEEVPLVSPETLPSALEESSPVYQKLDQHTPVFFLDYDGTLTPIVNRPEDAALSEEMRHLLRRLARLCTVAIVSGRDRQTVKNFVQLDELIYAGSHGFDITGPNNMNMQHEAGQAALPELDAAEQELQERLSHISGAQVERKKYAIAVHYRNVETEDVPGVKQIAEEILKQHPNLRKGGGKKIVELKPDIDWDKGKALLWLLNELKLDTPDIVPIYIGDDLTDEDAFRVLQSRGLGILVGEYGEETAAFYTLNSVQEVQRFLNEVIANLEDSSDE